METYLLKNNLLIVLLCGIFLQTVQSSPIGYDAILAIVIIELLFAFSVGLACIIFSFNLLRALKESEEDYSRSKIGTLPSRVSGSSSNKKNNAWQSTESLFDYRTFEETNGSGRRHQSIGSEMDEERQSEYDEASANNGIWRSFKTFGGYLKLW